MNINILYKEACLNKESEDRLFQHLSVSFRMFILRRVSNKQDAEDILQNTLAIVGANYRDIVITRSFSAWAYEVLKNQLLDYYKRKKLPKNQNLMLDESLTDSDQTDDNLIKRQLFECLKKLNQIHKTHARIINLHHLGFSTDEICSKLGISKGNFYISLHRARKMLSLCLEKGDI